jgi:hypothetical protein
LVGGAISTLFAAAAYWLHVAPPWPEDRTVAGATFLLGVVAYTVAAQLLAPGDERRLRSAAVWVLTVVLTAAAAYSLLWAFFTYRVSDDGDRVAGSWAKTARMQDYLASKGDQPVSTQDLLGDWDNDPDVVFEPNSLALVRCALLASWSLTDAALFALLTVFGLLVARRAGPADPVTARLQARVAGWPPNLDPHLRGELEQALRLLADGNVPLTILNVSLLLEGQHGLLGRVAAAHGRALQGGNLFAQIEELAGKGIVPGDIMSDLHWIRRRSNSARHDKGAVTLDDAHVAVNRAIHVIEWYHRTFGRGPRLPAPAEAIYGVG